MTAYELIEPDEQPFQALLGEIGSSIQDHILMGTQCRLGRAPQEGQWEYRAFANGALALVHRDATSRVAVTNELGSAVLASPEAVSLSVNLLALKDCQQGVTQEVFAQISTLHRALQEALLMETSTVVITKLYPDLQHRPPASRREIDLVPHREAQSILFIEG